MSASPIDHDEDLLKAGGTAALLVFYKPRIVDLFAERVHATLRDAYQNAKPMIVDTLPAFLTQMARTLNAPDRETAAAEYSNIALQHGDERAKLTGYSLSEVIAEYGILRNIIMEMLGPENIPHEDWTCIHRCIDEAIARAGSAFVQVHDRFRELFIAALTHDFRGPLGNAHNYLEVLRRAPDNSQRELLTTRAMDNLRRIDRMIVELLDVTRRRAGQRLPIEGRDCDAAELVRDVVDELRRRLGEHFVVDVPDSLAVHWGCDRIKQAVHNLLENAVKYGQPDAPITVRVEELGGRVQIAVHNLGEPIPPAEVNSLFQPFRRAAAAERSGKTGWGLGLVLVQAIAESHGGSVGVVSTKDKGTTFTLDILRDVREFRPPPADTSGALT